MNSLLAKSIKLISNRCIIFNFYYNNQHSVLHALLYIFKPFSYNYYVDSFIKLMNIASVI